MRVETFMLYHILREIILSFVGAVFVLVVWIIVKVYSCANEFATTLSYLMIYPDSAATDQLHVYSFE